MIELDLNNEILHDLYHLQRQFLEAPQVVDRRHRHLTTKDYGMAVFSVLPPQLPSARRDNMMRGHRYRSVSHLLTQTLHIY